MIELTENWVFQDGAKEPYKNSYDGEIICENCSHKNHISIKKGVRIPPFIICENCGCYTSSKIDREAK